jgi:hypothetical protein
MDAVVTEPVGGLHANVSSLIADARGVIASPDRCAKIPFWAVESERSYTTVRCRIAADKVPSSR